MLLAGLVQKYFGSQKGCQGGREGGRVYTFRQEGEKT